MPTVTPKQHSQSDNCAIMKLRKLYHVSLPGSFPWENAAVKMIPGFVDLQINGWGGVDFSSPGLTEADCERAFDEIGTVPHTQ